MSKRTALLILKATALTVLTAMLFASVFGLVTVIRYNILRKRCEERRDIPRVDIDTNGVRINSKENYVDCTVSISETDIDSLAAGIRGRGNTTWEFAPKKPYKIKFSEKVSVFGEEKNKSWVLLALYNDFSYIKDRLAFKLADAIGTDAFVPSYNYVELYLNGKYNGLYLMTDHVDENAGRTGIKERFDASDTQVPFLVELDAYAPDEGTEDVDWFSVGGKAYAVKYPDAEERYTEEQFTYIKNYIERVDSACAAGDYAGLKTLVDVDSFIDYYIIQEVMGQPEVNWKSVYMYKTKDGLMKMGPLWDFDWSVMGPQTGKSKDRYRDLIYGLRSCGSWFDLMLDRSPEFKADVSARFEEVTPVLLGVLDGVRAEKDVLSPYIARNHLRWNWYRQWNDWEDYYDGTLDWCVARIEWLGGRFA